MSRPAPRSPLPQTAALRGQVSYPNVLKAGRLDAPRVFGGSRGRNRAAARRAFSTAVGRLPDFSRDVVRDQWALFVGVTCGTSEAVAVAFDVTFQTAENWRAGFSTPTGDKVLLGAVLFPQAFAALVEGLA